VFQLDLPRNASEPAQRSASSKSFARLGALPASPRRPPSITCHGARFLRPATFAIEGVTEEKRPTATVAPSPDISMCSVSLFQGRPFQPSDRRSPPVALVNERWSALISPANPWGKIGSGDERRS
jgi:hypothetical protein